MQVWAETDLHFCMLYLHANVFKQNLEDFYLQVFARPLASVA